MGELSLINYVISCSFKWLGQSSDASGDGSCSRWPTHPTSGGGNAPRKAWEMWLSSNGLQRKTGIRNTQLMWCGTATDPDKRGQKGKNDMAETRLGDN